MKPFRIENGRLLFKCDVRLPIASQDKQKKVLRLGLDVEARMDAIGNPTSIDDIEQCMKRITDDLTRHLQKLWEEANEPIPAIE